MNRATLRAAITEAERFIRLAKDAAAELPDQGYQITGNRKSGAARRASMDLTRALADLRSNPAAINAMREGA